MALLGAALGLEVASWLVPAFNIGGTWRALSGAIGIALFGFLLRPILVRLAVLLGWVGALLVGLFGQTLIVWLVAWEPNDTSSEVTVWSAFIASWVVSAVSTGFVWLATAGTDDAATASLLRRARRRRPKSLPDADIPGIVFIQADGVPFPVLDWSVRAGTLPTLSRWVRGGSHRMAEWRPMLPATTPASQMGILHGSIDEIPAFRWVERSTGRVFVANKPSDAADIEALHSDGQGLLVDDGVSVSNLFTGDAPIAYATMSAVRRTQETAYARRTIAEFLARPSGLTRSISRVVAEIVRERFQQRRAIRRDIRPRVHRGWDFTIERAALSGLIHDLNASLVSDSMLQGHRSIYVDFVDYDAVAHHAGVMRPESLDALAAIDAALAQLEQVATLAPRPYHFVVLSDHGQAQGEIFASRYGEDLSELVARLAEHDVLSAQQNSEGSGSVNSMVSGASGTDTVLGRALGRASSRIGQQTMSDDTEAALADAAAPSEVGDEDRFIVFGSGNLGLVYVAGESHRLNLTELTERFPALVPGLVNHPGVGFVVVDTVDYGPVALGARGENRVRDGVVVGEDPLAPFGEMAAEFVLRAATMETTPDIYVNSLLDDLGEVAAFEGLVGCHGGLGGWQDRAMVVWPTELPYPEELVVGADALHDVLVGWLEQLGHRTDLPRKGVPTGDAESTEQPTQ